MLPFLLVANIDSLNSSVSHIHVRLYYVNINSEKVQENSSWSVDGITRAKLTGKHWMKQSPNFTKLHLRRMSQTVF